jgi:hypothetical protein
LLGAARDSGEDADVDISSFLTGCGRRLDFAFTDEVKFPAPLSSVVDGANLL